MTFQQGHKLNIGGNKGSFKKGHVPWHKGTKGLKEPWNKGIKGQHFSPKTEFRKGMVPWNKGLRNVFKHTKEWRQRNSIRMSGSNHPNWRGGVSFEPYPLGWSKTFREQIRYRDKYT